MLAGKGFLFIKDPFLFQKGLRKIKRKQEVTNVFSLVNMAPRLQNFFTCSTQLSMKFFLLINMKIPTIVGIFMFISREIIMLSYV